MKDQPLDDERPWEMKTAKKPDLDVMVFDNYNVACFDKDGQVPVLQVNLLSLWSKHADSCGYDVDGLEVETPHGNWKLNRLDAGGFNIERVD